MNPECADVNRTARSQALASSLLLLGSLLLFAAPDAFGDAWWPLRVPAAFGVVATAWVAARAVNTVRDHLATAHGRRR